MIGGEGMSNVPPIWKRIEGFLDRVFKDVSVTLREWLTAEEQISIYTEFYDYCSKTTGEQLPVEGIIGGDIYKLLSAYFVKLSEWTFGEISSENSIGKVIELYIFYWKRYEEGCLIVERALNYLDRHWVVHGQWAHLNPSTSNTANASNIPIPLRGIMWREWRRGVLRDGLLSKLLAYSEGVLSAERMAEMSIDPNSSIQIIISSFKSLSTIPLKSPLLELVKGGEIKQWCEEGEANFFLKVIIPWYCEGLKVDCKQIIESVGNRDCSLVIDRINFEVWRGEISRIRFYLGSDVVIAPPKCSIRFEKTLKSVLKESLIMPIIPQISFFIKDALSQNDEPSTQLKALYLMISVRKSILLNVMVAFEEGFRDRFKNKLPKPRNEQIVLWINLLFALYCEARSLCETAFNNDPHLREALNRAIRIFIGEDNYLICGGLGDYISRWIDHCFRDQIDIDSLRIDFFLLLSSTLDDKKTLQTALTSSLARRLIGRQAIVSREREDSFISSIGAHFGWGFVGGMSKMLLDIEESDTLSRDFTSKEKRSKLSFDYSFQILNAGFWPQSLCREDQQIAKNIPWDNQLKPLIDLFESFYKGNHSSRILNWSPSLTSAEVSITIASRKYSFIVNVPQFLILRVLEVSNKGVGLEVLGRQTGLTPSQIDYFMTVPSCYNLVIFKDSTYSLNIHFSSPHSRINLTTIHSSQSVNSTVSTVSRVPSFSVARELFSLQAAIVRSVKKMGKCAKNDPSLLGLSSNYEDLQKCIETLIEKEIIYEDSEKIEGGASAEYLLYNQPPSL